MSSAVSRLPSRSTGAFSCSATISSTRLRRSDLSNALRSVNRGGSAVFPSLAHALVWRTRLNWGDFPTGQDDQFGGPEPDDAHLTGVILRLNDDGATPEDNSFFKVGRERGGEVGANIQKVCAYGGRNSFGMAFDPLSGNLFTKENGADRFCASGSVIRTSHTSHKVRLTSCGSKKQNSDCTPRSSHEVKLRNASLTGPGGNE